MMFASILMAVVLLQPPPPPPTAQPITGTFPISSSISPYLTPITYTTTMPFTTSWPILDNFKRMLPVAVTVVGISLSVQAISTMLMWRVGVMALMFVFDFVLGKLGRTLSAINQDSAFGRFRSGVRSVRETSAYGRRMRGRR